MLIAAEQASTSDLSEVLKLLPEKYSIQITVKGERLPASLCCFQPGRHAVDHSLFLKPFLLIGFERPRAVLLHMARLQINGCQRDCLPPVASAVGRPRT